jgi:hypothetical protein
MIHGGFGLVLPEERSLADSLDRSDRSMSAHFWHVAHLVLPLDLDHGWFKSDLR